MATEQKKKEQQEFPELYGSEVEDENEYFQDMLNEAIIQSIFDQEQNVEEEQMLREVMKMSSLEHKKQNGEINLDALKRKNQPQEQPQTNNIQMVVAKQSRQWGDLDFKSSQSFDLPPVEVGAKKFSEITSTLKQKPAIIIKKQLRPLGQEGEEQKKKERSPFKQEQNSEIKNLIGRQTRKAEDSSFDNGLDQLLDSSVDLSNIKQQTNFDKSKVKEIMAKRRQADEKYEKVMGLNEQENIRGLRSNENDDTMISSAVNKSSLKQSKVRESEDDFDKIIGHIEGSRIENRKQVETLNPIKHNDLEDEDFF